MGVVKGRRRYNSPLRAEQASRTRKRIEAAARRLFLDRGYGATSLRAVAEAAGVAPDTVYDIFGTKRALLDAVVAAAVTGGMVQPEDWLEHTWAKEILALSDPNERLRRFIRHTAQTVSRTSPLHAVIRGAAASDPELTALDRRLHEQRFAAQQRLIGPVLGRAASDGEAETFSALSSPELHHLLKTVRGWTEERYAEWLERTVMALVEVDGTAMGVSADDRSKKAPPSG